jgi:hypothetical protein
MRVLSTAGESADTTDSIPPASLPGPLRTIANGTLDFHQFQPTDQLAPIASLRRARAGYGKVAIASPPKLLHSQRRQWFANCNLVTGFSGSIVRADRVPADLASTPRACRENGRSPPGTGRRHAALVSITGVVLFFDIITGLF